MYPLISIVVTVYNIMDRVKFVIKSLISQDYHNLEIIVVNDASTDDSLSVVEDFVAANMIGNVFIISHNKNKGVSAARNTGLMVSKGEYIAFVDGDDMLETNFVSELYRTISKTDSDFAACGYKTLELSNGQEVKHVLTVSEKINNEDILIGRILNKIEISNCATLFRKGFLVENGLSYEDGCSAGEDIEFLIKMLCRSKKASFCEDCLYIYVQHDNMGSRKEIKNNEKKIERYLHHTEAHFREAEYIKKHTKDKTLYTLAEYMILPQAYLRMLSVCAMKDDRDKFDCMRKSQSVKDVLLNSYRSFLYKPEVFLRACVVFFLPNVYYNKYRHYLND